MVCALKAALQNSFENLVRILILTTSFKSSVLFTCQHAYLKGIWSPLLHFLGQQHLNHNTSMQQQQQDQQGEHQQPAGCHFALFTSDVCERILDLLPQKFHLSKFSLVCSSWQAAAVSATVSVESEGSETLKHGSEAVVPETCRP